jgi:hypothetical protein
MAEKASSEAHCITSLNIRVHYAILDAATLLYNTELHTTILSNHDAALRSLHC